MNTDTRGCLTLVGEGIPAGTDRGDHRHQGRSGPGAGRSFPGDGEGRGGRRAEAATLAQCPPTRLCLLRRGSQEFRFSLTDQLLLLLCKTNCTYTAFIAGGLKTFHLFSKYVPRKSKLLWPFVCWMDEVFFLEL